MVLTNYLTFLSQNILFLLSISIPLMFLLLLFIGKHKNLIFVSGGCLVSLSILQHPFDTKPLYLVRNREHKQGVIEMIQATHYSDLSA